MGGQFIAKSSHMLAGSLPVHTITYVSTHLANKKLLSKVSLLTKTHPKLAQMVCITIL